MGTFAHAHAHHGVRPVKISENNSLKQRVLRHRFPPPVQLVEHAGSSGTDIQQPSVLMAIGLPCQPFAPGGGRLAEADPRAVESMESVPRAVTSLGNRYISVDIEEHADFALRGAKVLKHIDERLASNSPSLVRSPASPCMFDSVSFGGKVLRRRGAWRWELASVVARIGLAPPLRPMLTISSCIRDIALPDADIHAAQYVPGVLRLVDHCVSKTEPTVSATLTFGGDGVPIGLGSRVRHPAYDFILVVVAFPDDERLPISLMRDVRGRVAYFHGHMRTEAFVNIATTFDVFSMDGIAASFTNMAVPPLGSAKQLWLRNGRAYAPDYRELIRLLECHVDILFPLSVDAGLASKDVDSVVGDMLSMQLAEAQAHRSVCREAQFRTAIALDVAKARGCDSLECRAAASFCPVAYGLPNAVFVVLVTQDDDGNMRALVSDDNRQLPMLPGSGDGRSARQARVDVASRFCATLNLPCGFDPHSFLVFDRPWLSVVACPLLDLVPGAAYEFAAWRTLAEVSNCDVYLPIIAALSRVASHCQRGTPVSLRDVSDGAMRARRIVALPYTPSSVPSAWPSQLHYLEAVDTHARRVLSAVANTHPHKQYLTEWIDQIDTSPNADIPPSLRGVAMTSEEESAFVDVEFYDPCPIEKIEAPTFPKPQVTKHRPKSLDEILLAWAIRQLATGLRPIIAVMKLQRAGLPVPRELLAQCKTIVIGQDGFVEAARGIIWDLRRRHPDGYFMPLDFNAPLNTHLHTQAMFDALGDDFLDQSLRHQILRGALFFAKLDLQIVICPHMLSLGDAFTAAEADLTRLSSLGYLSVVSTEHEALGDDELICALGILPVRCTSQGTRCRKLKPQSPRRISNAGGPHKKLGKWLVDGDGVPVLPLNVAIGFRSVVNGKPKFGKENKPHAPGVMSDICVLRVPARILGEPILQFNDDSSDAFNQFHLHPSQIYMTSILWLKLHQIASKCEYSHILEHSFGFGYSNASYFCQRFGNALLHMVTQRMRQLEARVKAKVTDPSLLAWYAKREALGPNQGDLFRMWVFTDDPHFVAVGFDRWVRLLCCWRDVTLMVGLRMAQAAKRQGGTSILWVGLRFHGTFGAVVIPPPKRARAISELRRMHSGDEFTLEDAMSIAGLLEHLTPFASELRSSMYHMYYPHKAFHKHGMQFRFLPPPSMQNQARKWMERLVQRPGIACTAVLISAREEGGTTLVMSSDAAKDGTPTPGVGGHMHGFSWYLPLLPSDVVGPLQLPINWLEFLAVYGNFEIFGPSVPLLHSRLLQLTDSLTSAIVLTRHSAKSEGMQLVHLALLESSEFVRLAAITDVAHVFGPGMVFADAVSRGYFDIVKQLCIQCHTAHQWLVVPASVVALLDELRALARKLAGVSDRLTQRPLSKKEQYRSRSQREANKGSYGPMEDKRPSQFPSFRDRSSAATPPTPRFGSPASAPVQFVSFRTPSASASMSRVRVVSPPPAVARQQTSVVRPVASPPRQPKATPSSPQGAASDARLFALRRSGPSAFPRFTQVASPSLRQAPRRMSSSLHFGPAPPAVASVRFTTRPSSASLPVDHTFHIMPAPPTGRPLPSSSSTPAGNDDLFEALQSDTSRFALCPNDPGMLRGLIRDVGAAVMRSAKPNTARKDRSAWRKWVAFCRMLNTPEMRTCVDAHSGVDPFGARRERFMQAAFFLYAFRTMVPKNRAHKTAKPASARACLDCVRRVHKHSDIAMCPAPSVALMLRGLMDEYVHIHGAECLVPRRREPLTNEQTRAILTIPPRTKLGTRVVDWNCPLFVNFAAFLTTLRQSGSRKADLLSVTPEEFDPASMSRWNLKWYINGEIVDCPTLAQLRALKPGDAAVIIPGCTKADPFSIMFGDKPIYLLFDASDVCNAAWRLRELEIKEPVPAEHRRQVPLFCSDADNTPLSHALADSIFNAACLLCFGAQVAKTLSLHSGRVWLACALLAAGHSTATIQAMCRWLSPAAVRIYAHMNPEAAMSTLASAIQAPITSRLVTNLPTTDADSDVREIANDLSGKQVSPALSLAGRARSQSVPALSSTVEHDDDDGDLGADFDCQVESAGMCDGGSLLADAQVTVGASVAVPFSLGSHQVHFQGTVSSLRSSSEVYVTFPDERPWLVARDRLYAVVALGDGANGTH